MGGLVFKPQIASKLVLDSLTRRPEQSEHHERWESAVTRTALGVYSRTSHAFTRPPKPPTFTPNHSHSPLTLQKRRPSRKTHSLSSRFSANFLQHRFIRQRLQSLVHRASFVQNFNPLRVTMFFKYGKVVGRISWLGPLHCLQQSPEKPLRLLSIWTSIICLNTLFTAPICEFTHFYFPPLLFSLL
ncbi:hypothetical protein VTN49DRAFT_7380 [Thermomyces lanuginosus]|uniref:uncharacterized protein n=1 Tax=Thermomyces lanuginosus TaxID=5541 RepID=UPI003742D095